jgi:regulator of protease activity HflC (stomatin/prohibitin superfamily)
MLTGDENIIDIDLVVQYRIADPAKYLLSVTKICGTRSGSAIARHEELKAIAP